MPDSLSDDLLDGVNEISAFLGSDKFPPRRIHHLIDRDLLPVGRIGRRIIGSKQRISEHLARVTAGEAA
jgi:hypothetical protein